MKTDEVTKQFEARAEQLTKDFISRCDKLKQESQDEVDRQFKKINRITTIIACLLTIVVLIAYTAARF